MARYHVRCRKCEGRRVLRQHPDHYLRPPKCACGAKDWRLDMWMTNRKTGLDGQGCDCSGYWFRHRMGSKHCHKDKYGNWKPWDPAEWDY